MIGSCIDDRHLPLIHTSQPHRYLSGAQRAVPANTRAPAHKDDTSRAQAHRPNSQRVTWGHQRSGAV